MEAVSNRKEATVGNDKLGCSTRPSALVHKSVLIGGTTTTTTTNEWVNRNGCSTRPSVIVKKVGTPGKSSDMFRKCGDVNPVGICVIKTPIGGESSDVQFVSPYANARLEFDEDLCERSAFLPEGYCFSVKVYTEQYLHVKKECMVGTCQCIYFLDSIPVMLKPCRLAALLCKYRLQSNDDMFVLGGVCRGFKVVDRDIDISYSMSNYKSILTGSMHSQMCDTVRRELLLGNISQVPVPPKCVHAMGAVVRPDGRLRAITDCSRPSNSVNCFMSSTAKKFNFSKIEDTRKLVVAGGVGCVVDISNAYRHVAVYPPHRQYLGFKWELEGSSMYFEDNSLCFGLRSAPSIFNSISDLIVRLMFRQGIPCQGYLDDYFLASTSYAECKTKQGKLIDLLACIGFSVNPKKVTDPSSTPKYLGIIIDLENMRFRLPEEKL